MELENEIKNNLKIEKEQNNFLKNIISKTINNAIDMGLRSILPDLIENQIIDIKDALLENGLKGGINTAIESTIDFAKSTLGIFTGNFENMSQVKIAIGNGGIIDTISKLLDKSINKIYELGYINSTVNKIIINGKNTILNNVTNNIRNTLDEQDKAIENIQEYINNWKENYNNKNFDGMEKEFYKIEKQLNKVIPIEEIIKEARKVENMHNLIANNGHNFEITDVEKELINKLF